MSEHQYYEFRAVDRPPGRTEQRELRAISTRAQITAAGFVNHYEWGDFRGNPDRLVSRYFDLFLYLANWGSRRLSIRLPTIARREAGLCRGGGPGWLAFDGAIDGVDQHLGLDKLDPRPLGLVAIERRGKRLCEGVAVIGHTLARLFQRLKSLAHVGFAFCCSRVSYWREKYGQEPLVDAGPEQNSDDTMVKPGSVRHGKCRRVDGAPDTIRTCDLCLRRATLYPAELRVRRVHLADWPGVGNGPSGAGWARNKARKAKITRSNRVGRPEKRVPDVPGLRRVNFIEWTIGGPMVHLHAGYSPRRANERLHYWISRCYSAIASPEPPNSAGKSFSLGRPSRMRSTVSA